MLSIEYAHECFFVTEYIVDGLEWGHRAIGDGKIRHFALYLWLNIASISCIFPTRARVTTDRTLKKSYEVGVKTSEELLDLSKKGVTKVKKAVSSETDPLTIARIRYAKGEISQQDMKKWKKYFK